MKKHIIKYLTKVLWGAVVIISISSCSSSDDILDEDYVPTEEEITETLKDVNTEWGTSKESIQQYMKGYQLVESLDENILQFNANRLPVTIAYQFSSKNKLCAAMIMTRKGEEKSDIQKSLEGFDYIGESSSNDIYSNKNKNVFAVAYETTEDEENYQIIGFTPLSSMTEIVNGKECADLGLSVKWATCNVGANNPEDYGGYYAWGETDEKDSYSWNTYKYCSGSSSTCTNIGDNIGGTQYDVVHTVFGSSWTLPTKDEMDELRTKCDWVWTTENGIKGYKVFGDNGNYIFLPAAGYKTTSLRYSGTNGYYITATQYKTNYYAYDLEFTSSKRTSNYMSRCYGGSVRAVLK